MFSVQQKRDISDAVQKILRVTNHPELPTTGEIGFNLHVEGAEDWSYADIRNNGAVGDPGLNPHNELMASIPEEEARGLIEKAHAHEVKQTIGDAAMPDPTLTPLTDLQQRLTKELKGIHIDVHAHEIRLTQLESFFKEIMEDDVIQHHDDQLHNLMTAVTGLKDYGNRISQIESVAEDRAKDLGQLRMLVTDLNNAAGSIQDQVNDVADEIRRIKEGTDGKAGSE